MDYSILKTIHSSTPENLTSVHPAVYANYLFNSAHHNHHHHSSDDVATDRLSTAMPLTSPAQTPANSDADDAMLLMDCSRSSSSIISPHPPHHRLTETPQLESATATQDAEATNAAAMPSLTNTSTSDSTKLKLNFSMDRILSRVETSFCPPNRMSRTGSGGACSGCDSNGANEDEPVMLIGYNRTTNVVDVEQQTIGTIGGTETIFAPVAFSVASMLGLHAANAANGGKPIFRPMPVYVTQSGALLDCCAVAVVCV